MKFKKIIALICAAAIMTANVSAFTPFLPEETETENGSESETESEKTESDADKDKDGSSSAHQGVYKPKNIYSRLFKQILETYVENHLYEFTDEDVLYKFFDDFLTENPMYFKFFTNYMLGTMDPYSSYHEADDGFLDGESSSLGFGLKIGEDENGSVVVEKVYEGSNAEKAGILPGDKFAGVMGFKVDDLPIDAVTAVVSNIKSFLPEEEAAKNEEEIFYDFEFIRNGEAFSVSMAKGDMYTGNLEISVEENDGKTVGVITVYAFLGEDTDTLFVEAVKNFYEQGITRLTIDLRDNGGGNLDYALTMAECFVPNGELLCYYRDKTLEEPRPIYSTTEQYTFDSIAILVNEHTASAAELFSHILNIKGLAKLVGTQTYGKGIGQTVYTLINGDYITITSYEMLDQNMENYNEMGLVPDLVIDETEMCYELPELLWFNHENYKEIEENVYSDAAKALEQRLCVAGLLFEDDCDGIFDDTTRRAVYALQLYLKLEPTGTLNDETVTKITSLINAYKSYTYYEDSPFEVSLYMHRSFSQGKRRLAEINKVAKKEQKKIEEREKALEEALEKEDAEKEQAENK